MDTSQQSLEKHEFFILRKTIPSYLIKKIIRKYCVQYFFSPISIKFPIHNYQIQYL